MGRRCGNRNEGWMQNALEMLLNGFRWGVAVGIGMKVGWRTLWAINYCFEIGEIVRMVFFAMHYIQFSNGVKAHPSI